MEQMNKAIISKINKDIYFVSQGDAIFECRQTGNLYKNNVKPTVGDYCLFDKSTLRIKQLLPRKNTLIRPLISNIDKLFIVVSTTIPSFSSYQLDKFLIIAGINKIIPIIIFTKEDKLKLKEKININKYKNYYKNLGYKVYSNKNTNKIKKEFKNSIVALAGQTGAGKSTLLNMLNKDLKIETNEVSTSLGRGKHTTRIVQLYSLFGGLIADTPGFSSLELDIEKEKIKNYYKEFDKVNCKYKTCMHIKENDCEVKKIKNNNKIFNERYENYVKLVLEVGD